MPSEPKAPMTVEDFAAKIEWEGGTIDALDYGLSPEDAPEGELRDLWQAAYDIWTQQLKPAIGQIDDWIEAYEAYEAAGRPDTDHAA